MEEIKTIETALLLLKNVRSCQLKVDKLTNKVVNMHYTTHSIKSINRENANLNWACMNLDKAKTDFARCIIGSCLDVSVEVKEYNPSGFHNYKH